MIDFHSHILPGVDDGSGSTEESVQLLSALQEQGVDTVAATPHFYATQRTPSRFLERREEALGRLRDSLSGRFPEIICGAEVLYFPGVSRMEELPRLCLEGTNLLLLEMPFESWSEGMIREVHDLSRSGRFTLMLAHVERYYSMQPASVWDGLLEAGVLMQSNADFFLHLRTRRKALKLMREGRIHLLGSDCHNMRSRPPRMREAAQIIEKRLGREVLAEMDAFGRSLLPENARV